MTDGRGPAGPSRYEPKDVPSLLPFWLALLLVACLFGVLLAIELGYPIAGHQEMRGPVKPLPGQPRLQLAPVRDLQRYRSAKAQELHQPKPSVSIDAAIQETARQGWGPPK